MSLLDCYEDATIIYLGGNMTWLTSKNPLVLSFIATAWSIIIGIVFYFLDQMLHSKSGISIAGPLGLYVTGYCYGRVYREEMSSKLRHHTIQWTCVVETVLSVPVLYTLRTKITSEFLIIYVAAILILYFPCYWILGNSSRSAVKKLKS